MALIMTHPKSLAKIPATSDSKFNSLSMLYLYYNLDLILCICGCVCVVSQKCSWGADFRKKNGVRG